MSTYCNFTVIAYLQDSSGAHSSENQCDATALMVICGHFLVCFFVTVTDCKHKS